MVCVVLVCDIFVARWKNENFFYASITTESLINVNRKCPMKLTWFGTWYTRMNCQNIIFSFLVSQFLLSDIYSWNCHWRLQISSDKKNDWWIDHCLDHDSIRDMDTYRNWIVNIIRHNDFSSQREKDKNWYFSSVIEGFDGLLFEISIVNWFV